MTIKDTHKELLDLGIEICRNAFHSLNQKENVERKTTKKKNRK